MHTFYIACLLSMVTTAIQAMEDPNKKSRSKGLTTELQYTTTALSRLQISNATKEASKTPSIISIQDPAGTAIQTKNTSNILVDSNEHADDLQAGDWLAGVANLKTSLPQKIYEQRIKHFFLICSFDFVDKLLALLDLKKELLIFSHQLISICLQHLNPDDLANSLKRRLEVIRDSLGVVISEKKRIFDKLQELKSKQEALEKLEASKGREMRTIDAEALNLPYPIYMIEEIVGNMKQVRIYFQELRDDLTYLRSMLTLQEKLLQDLSKEPMLPIVDRSDLGKVSIGLPPTVFKTECSRQTTNIKQQYLSGIQQREKDKNFWKIAAVFKKVSIQYGDSIQNLSLEFAYFSDLFDSLDKTINELKSNKYYQDLERTEKMKMDVLKSVAEITEEMQAHLEKQIARFKQGVNLNSTKDTDNS